MCIRDSSIVDTLIPVIGGTDFDATEENIQSRIRTLMLMALQNMNGYVLLNCSNKSENALGICTLYGDTGGAFSVTGDLYKTEMYDLARYINRKFGAPIPENILTKEPSSELRPNQKDSDMLPSYEVVDAILYRLIEDGQSREEIINAGFDSDEVQKIYAMVMRLSLIHIYRSRCSKDGSTSWRWMPPVPARECSARHPRHGTSGARTM